ncbi:condensation domain-containing protein [Bacillus sp. R86525]|uniref:condensation domain-containing protein n=1 Tax=Bacillus sp. R86525 TaxID=3101709 RepID=UPI0036711A54
MNDSKFYMNKKRDKDVGDERKEKIYELSLNQYGLWFLDRLIPNSPLYSVPWMCKIEGDINIMALQTSLQRVWERHDVLRSRVIMANNKPFIVCSGVTQVPFHIVDLTDFNYERRQNELNRLISLESTKPFNIENEELMRSYLFSYSKDNHVLVFNMHHIIFDGWSMEILLREIAITYNAIIEGKEPKLPELHCDYFEFSKINKERINNEDKEVYLAYWRNKLNAVSKGNYFPSDFPKLPEQKYKGKILTRKLPEHLTEKLSYLARNEKSTLYMVLLSAFKVLLHKYTGSFDLLIGSPMAGRSKTEYESLIGYFVNLVALRTTFNAETTFKELLKEVKRTTLEAYTYQDIPLDILAKELMPKQNNTTQALIQTVFAYEDDATLGINMEGLKLLPIEGLPTFTSKFDSTWTVTNKGEFLEINVEFNTDLFDEKTIQRYIDHYEALLQNILDHPNSKISTLEILSENEIDRFTSDKVLILDENLKPVPVGVSGQIFINNVNIDMEYALQYPNLKDKLVENPFEKGKYLLKIGRGKKDREYSVHIQEVFELNLETVPLVESKSNVYLDNLQSITGKAMAVIWKEVLGVQNIELSDNFFELGGHSLLAIQIMVRVREAFGVDVPLRSLFETQNIGEFINAVEEAVTADVNVSSGVE